MNQIDTQRAFIGKPARFPEDHPQINHGKVGVLLVNLGTPDGTSYWPMRRYLKEFLSDKRVIEWPKAIWWPILNGIVLSVRPQKSGKAYESIWNHEMNESPLRTFTRSQSDKLAEALAERAGTVVVDWAMRYGSPSIRSKMEGAAIGRDASASSSFRFIRNMPPRRRRPSTTRCSRR